MFCHYLITVVLVVILIFCSLPTTAAGIEITGIMQYDVSETVVPDWLKRIDNWGQFRRSLHKVWARRKGVDVNVTFCNVKDGKTCTKNLKQPARLDLPNGHYRVKCDKYDVSVVERRGELNYIINREAEFWIYSQESSYLDRNSNRSFELLFYPKGSSVTVKGRIVDDKGTPLKCLDVCGGPDIQSEAYAYIDKKANGSLTYRIQTDANGEFVFENQPPAAVELGVYYLLTGRETRPMESEGETALNFNIHIRGYYLSNCSMQKKYYRKVKLISESNLPALRRTADKLWMALPEDGKRQFMKIRTESIDLPISTNNVIYVGDIVVHKDNN